MPLHHSNCTRLLAHSTNRMTSCLLAQFPLVELPARLAADSLACPAGHHISQLHKYRHLGTIPLKCMCGPILACPLVFQLPCSSFPTHLPVACLHATMHKLQLSACSQARTPVHAYLYLHIYPPTSCAAYPPVCAHTCMLPYVHLLTYISACICTYTHGLFSHWKS